MELHNGSIACKSHGHGMGCDMTVEIPLYRRSGNDVENFSGHSQSRRQHLAESWTTASVNFIMPTTTMPRTVLIADDSAICRKMVNRVLVQAGYTCVLCSDGEECVNTVLNMRDTMGVIGKENAEIKSIDLILLDYEVSEGASHSSALNSLCREH